jgi:hypothetical protein
MAEFLNGAIMMAYAVGGLFFVKFWRASRDRLFAMFSIAFFVLSANRFLLPRAPVVNEGLPIYYVVRLVAYLVILAAILDKNYGRKQ